MQWLGNPLIWRRLLIIASSAVLLFAAYHIVEILLDRKENHETYAAVNELFHVTDYKVEEKDELKNEEKDEGNEVENHQEMTVKDESSTPSAVLSIQKKFNKLLELNDDVVGWLKIDDTVIDYPVVQAENNDYYLNKDITGKRNSAGSIFMDYRNRVDQPDQLSRNTILYGHNMKDKTMFASLLHYESLWYFNEHPIIEFDTLYDNFQWEVFAAYKTDVEFDYIQTEFTDDDQYESYLTAIQLKSLHKSNANITADDTILTLSTCTNITPDDRFTVHAKLIKK